MDNIENNLVLYQAQRVIRLTKKVEFTSMDKGTRDDYDLISIHDSDNKRNLVSRVIEWLKIMDGDSPYKIVIQHCLQTATKRRRRS